MQPPWKLQKCGIGVEMDGNEGQQTTVRFSNGEEIFTKQFWDHDDGTWWVERSVTFYWKVLIKGNRGKESPRTCCISQIVKVANESIHIDIAKIKHRII